MSFHTASQVEVFDFETKEVKLMPTAEVGPGMIRARIEPLGREYWVMTSQTRLPSQQKGAVHHGPFDKKVRAKLRRIMGALADVKPLSLDEWKRGFRRDRDPIKEINIWLRIAETYTGVAHVLELTPEQKHELFGVIVDCSTVPYERVLDVATLDALPVEIAREAVEAYFGQPQLKKAVAYKLAEEYRDPFGNTPVPVCALEDPAVRKGVEACAVVFGVDSHTGRSILFYGAESIDEIIASGVPKDLPTMSFLFDMRTAQLELLFVAVEKLKGSCCYRGGE